MSFDLFQLLPAIYRIRDAQIAASQTLLTPAELADLNALQALTPPLPADLQSQLDELTAKASRGPLESLLKLIGEQLAAVAYDIDQLYDDQFIETCAPWVIPYIGDLIGYQSIKGINAAVDNPRAEVAETISLRRRKGTVLVMEQLARDVTGWGAHAVEFFSILADTQYMNHIRPGNHYAPDLRRWQPGLYMNTGFDATAHKVDVRRIASSIRGEAGLNRYNIQNIGIFLWSLSAYSVTNASATPVSKEPAGGELCYHFSPLGMDIPLFHRAVSQGEQISATAQPVNVADRLRRRVLCDDLQKGVGASFYGPGNSLSLTLNGNLLNPYQIRVADLSGPEGAWNNLPTGSQYAAVIDPELGRIALPKQSPATLQVSYYRGFNADMGGGEYARSAGFVVTDPAWIVPFPDPRFPGLQDALNFALTQLQLNGQVAVEVSGSGPIALAVPLAVDLPAGTTLELRAADSSSPTLLLDGEISVTGDASSTFVLNGFIMAGGSGMAPGPGTAVLLHVPPLRPAPLGTTNLLGQFSLTHCTLLPGWSGAAPALIVESAGTSVEGTRSILGAIQASALATVTLSGSIVDATDPANPAYTSPGGSGGGALTLEGCTVVGKVHAVLLTLVSNSIVWAAAGGLVADRRQEGCVRFSFLPYGAIVPSQYECVERAVASPQPLFAALRYGHPAYLKLLACTDDTIRRGAHDGNEMGAFHFVMAPQRESDLRIRLQEYIPVGLEFGLIYQN